MRGIARLHLVLVGGLVAACGGDPEPPPAATPVAKEVTNEPPVVREVQLLPSRPTAGDTITLSIRAVDPDADSLTNSIQWFQNGRLLSEGQRTTLRTDGFQRGDSVHAVVTTSDGQHQVTSQTDSVSINNRLPRVLSLRIMPDEPKADMPLTVFADARDEDGDPIELSYQWYVNEKSLSGQTKADLPAGSFKRGDTVQVEVVADDGRDRSEPSRSTKMTVPNSAPEIDSDPASAKVRNGIYKYKLRGSDPDADRPLRYELVDGPDGMSVDLLSGVVSWRVPRSAKGSYPVRVSVSDPIGGRAEQSYVIELSWDQEPANAE